MGCEKGWNGKEFVKQPRITQRRAGSCSTLVFTPQAKACIGTACISYIYIYIFTSAIFYQVADLTARKFTVGDKFLAGID